MARRRSAIWWFQVYGWSAYGLSVYIALLPALPLRAWLAMLGVKALRTGLGVIASLVLMRIYDRLRGRSVGLLIAAVVAGSAILGAAWLVGFEVALTVGKAAPLRTVAWSRLPRDGIDYAFVLLAWSGAYLGMRLWRDAERARRSAVAVQTQMAEVELEMLRYQLNPHFLFNALNSIRASVPADATIAREMINDLSRFMRHILTPPTAMLVPLSQEWAAVASYLAIEQRRFEDRLRVTMRLDPDLAGVQVPAFLLHTLAENAITHGLPGRAGAMEVEVSTTQRPGRICLEVANTGLLRAPEGQPGHGPSTGIGLHNVRRRLARVYGDRAALTVEQAGAWVRARVDMPLAEAAPFHTVLAAS